MTSEPNPTIVGDQQNTLKVSLTNTLTLKPELRDRIANHFVHCCFCGGRLALLSICGDTVCGTCGTNHGQILRRLLAPDLPLDGSSSFAFDFEKLNEDLDVLRAVQGFGPRSDFARRCPWREAAEKVREYSRKLQDEDQEKRRQKMQDRDARSGSKATDVAGEVAASRKLVDGMVAEATGKVCQRFDGRTFTGPRFECHAARYPHPLWAVLIGIGLACFCFAVYRAVTQHL